jgi:hypothetical protein
MIRYRHLIFAGLALTAGTSISIGVLGLNGLFATSVLTHVLITGMGLGLEAGKYSVVIYLHSRWYSTRWLLRSLMLAVALTVMALTSFEVLALLSQQQLSNTGAGSTIAALAAVYAVDVGVLTAIISLSVTAIVEPMSLALTFAACGMLGVKASKPKPKSKIKPKAVTTSKTHQKIRAIN